MAGPGSGTGAGEASVSAVERQEDIDGLAELFEQARLRQYFGAAEALLRDWGAVDVEEVVGDTDLLGQLEEHLQLKLLERRRLEAAVAGRPTAAGVAGPVLPRGTMPSCREPLRTAPHSSSGSTGVEVHPPARNPPPAGAGGAIPAAHAPDGTVVRNTFIEYKDAIVRDLPRTSTAPPTACRRRASSGLGGSLTEEVDEEEEEFAGSVSPPGDSRAPRTPAALFDRTVTWDSYENEVDPTTTLPPDAQPGPPFPPPFGQAPPGSGAGGGLQLPAVPPMMWPMPAVPPVPPVGWIPGPGMEFGPGWSFQHMIGQYGQQLPYGGQYFPGVADGTPGDAFRQQLAASEQGGSGLFGASGSGEDDGKPPPPQALERTFSINSGSMRVHWTVSARKLKSKDSHPHLSPSFELSFGTSSPSVPFKMMITPKVASETKGGASFKKARGVGFIELVCEETLPDAVPQVSYKISIGSGDKRQPARGPVTHDFSKQAVSRFPKGLAEWDFQSAVDHESMTFVVCLEIIPTTAKLSGDE